MIVHHTSVVRRLCRQLFTAFLGFDVTTDSFGDPWKLYKGFLVQRSAYIPTHPIDRYFPEPRSGLGKYVDFVDKTRKRVPD